MTDLWAIMWFKFTGKNLVHKWGFTIFTHFEEKKRKKKKEERALLRFKSGISTSVRILPSIQVGPYRHFYHKLPRHLLSRTCSLAGELVQREPWLINKNVH